MSAIIGLDVGGAHLKLSRVTPAGRLEAARIAPCPLWRGLNELEKAFASLEAEIPPAASFAVTMTGELVDLWTDRQTGVAAISEAVGALVGRDRLVFYAGAAGFVPAGEEAAHWSAIASANWRATAAAAARGGETGLLIDIGSTTSDLIPFASGEVLARGTDDAGRMAADELVYLGVARTPVMALAARMPFGGGWISPMAEFFATTADVFRLTGDLPDGADLHPAADGGAKTTAASARRLLRMVGADLDAQTEVQAHALAAWLAEAMLRRLCDATALIMSRPDAGRAPTVFGAGVGRFLARRLADRLGLMYRDLGREWSEDEGLAAAAADCAPAVAVARLLAAR